MLVLFINAHRSLLLHMNDVCKSSVAKSDWCPIFDWWILLPKPGAMTEEVCTSEPWIAQKFEPVNSNNSSVQMFSDVFSTLFLGYKNHQKPSRTIKNHQKPSKTYKNHQKPSKSTLLRETSMGFFKVICFQQSSKVPEPASPGSPTEVGYLPHMGNFKAY